MRFIRVLAALLAVACPVAAQELTEETSGKWKAYIIPPKEELAWREISWRPTLWDALLEAQEKEKPILLWAMNGHPLACT